MELALYCPICGYYEREEDTIGRRGDYYTSVSVGSLFGELLAFQFADGSGSGVGRCQASGDEACESWRRAHMAGTWPGIFWGGCGNIVRDYSPGWNIGSWSPQRPANDGKRQKLADSANKVRWV